jgi:SAM-dependent methyltransferase
MFKKRDFPRKPHVFTSKYLYWATIDLIAEVKRKFPQLQTALDVPSGGGAIAKFMVENLRLDVQASDIDRSKYDYTAPFQAADLGRKLPYQDETFDLTVCMEGLKHVSDIEAAVKELSRVTKKNGFVLITIPNDLCLQARLRYLFDGFVDTDWTKPLAPDDQNVKEHVHLKSLTSLPYLYFFLVSNRLKLLKTQTSHMRFWSWLFLIPLYPFVLLGVSRAMPMKHPLFKEMISPVWLTGRRNLILCQKS